MGTVDDYGTPGYVAPEQAYGRPTYRSDCFAVGLILYEYLTGVLPRWPFRWPFKGHERLRERTNGAVAQVIRRTLQVDPEKRFGNAEKMRAALREAAGKLLSNGNGGSDTSRAVRDWRKVRREAFIKRYGKVFIKRVACVSCGEPVAETMGRCPWCGSKENVYDYYSQFSHVCSRCRKGVLPEWRYCPWCYGAGFSSPSWKQTKGVRYQDHCRYCGEKLMRFMRYCPWCHRKVKQAWAVSPFPEICGRCGWSVDSSFWDHCPWCVQRLTDR